MSNLEAAVAQLKRAYGQENDELVIKLVSDNPAIAEACTFPMGGTVLHSYSAEGNAKMVAALIAAGANPNVRGAISGEVALVPACASGSVEAASVLIRAGSVFDVSESQRNALFAAVLRNSVGVTRLLINEGFDTKARYNTSSRRNMDAVAFALMYGAKDCAQMIALHNASGDEVGAKRLMDEALEVAMQNV